MKTEYKLLIDNRWVEGETVQPVINPYNGSEVAKVHRASKEQIESAVAAACRAFEEGKATAAYRRAETLRAIAQGIGERAEQLARCIALEAGKPLKEARPEVERAQVTFRLAAEEATRRSGEILPLDIAPSAGDRIALVRRFPIGPLLAITPFNFPLNLVAHKVAPALAVGNPVVLKPASATPISALILGDIAVEADLPRGMLNVISCPGSQTGPLVEDERIKMISFTGSAEVGWQLKAQAGKKRVSLELGGNAALVVEPDADLTYAAERAVVGGFAYAGQICISIQRILLHEQIYDRFLELFLPLVKKLAVANPLEETTALGPMIDEGQAARAEEWVKEAVREGAVVLCGGKRRKSHFPATVVTGVNPKARLSCQEVFAPVVVVSRYADFDQALAQVNDSAYGLQAGVFTNNVEKALASFNRLDVGGVILNDIPTFRVDSYPYGGVKDSGCGREGVRYAMEEMSELKVLVLKNSR